MPFSKEHKKFIKILDGAFHSDLVSKVHSASFFTAEDKAVHKGRYFASLGTQSETLNSILPVCMVIWCHTFL